MIRSGYLLYGLLVINNLNLLENMKSILVSFIVLASACCCKAQELTSKLLHVGDVSIEWLKDKPGEAMRAKSVFADAPDSILISLGLQKGIPSSVSCFLMSVNGQDILFDTGLGGGTSLLTETLAKQGKKPEEIKLIYITHLHGDHIGGMLKNGKAVFPNAEIYLNEMEYVAWMGMPKEKNEKQRKVLDLYRDRLHLFHVGDTLPAGIVPIEAYGHTPGHTVFQKGGVLVIGDLMHGAELQMKHPEYCASYDMDKKKAIESRKRILDYAKKNGLVMAGMHLPAPGFIDLRE